MLNFKVIFREVHDLKMFVSYIYFNKIIWFFTIWIEIQRVQKTQSILRFTKSYERKQIFLFIVKGFSIFYNYKYYYGS